MDVDDDDFEQCVCVSQSRELSPLGVPRFSILSHTHTHTLVTQHKFLFSIL